MNRMAPVTSNGVVSRDMILKVVTSTTANDHGRDVASWIARVVSQKFPVKVGWYPHMVVGGTLCSDQNLWDGSKKNELLFAVHESSMDSTPNSFWCNSEFTDLIVTDEKNNAPPVLNADQLADALYNDDAIPDAVLAVGVSGVSQAFAEETWFEIISPQRNWMDGNGWGYMIHPMRMWSQNEGLRVVGEMSYQFGWSDNYYALCKIITV